MAESEGIRRSQYSTSDLPPDISHDLWSERGWPSVAALFKSTPIGAFSTSAEEFGLADLVVSYASGTARVLERTPERIASDGVDILGVGLLLEGTMEGIAASREFQLGPGEILLFDLSQPITMTISDSRSIQVAIPRSMAEADLGPVAVLHGRVIGQPASRSFGDRLLELRGMLDSVAAEDAPRLAALLTTSLAQALSAAKNGR